MSSIRMSILLYQILVLFVSLTTATITCVPGFSETATIQKCKLENDRIGILWELPPYLKIVEILYLNQSGINYIDSTAFHSLTNLRYLYLNNNRLRMVSLDWFGKHANIVNIDLSENLISDVSDGAFSQCKSIEYINLSANLIENFRYPSNDLKNASVDLSMNPLKRIEIGSVYSLHLNRTNLTELHLENDVVEIYAEDSRISSFYVASSSDRNLSLEVLVLAGNNLVDTRNITELNGGGPRHLDLSRNKIHAPSPGAFLNLHRLQHLNLSGTNIQHLYYGLFANQVDLRVLDLSNNRLTHLNTDHLRRTRDRNYEIIEDLYVQNNPISEIRHDRIFFQYLRKFGFGGNSLYLNCEKMLELYITLQQSGVIIFVPDHLKRFDVDNVGGISCSDRNK